MIEPISEIIRKCLTRCPECTGRYISDILGKRFICHCPCHFRKGPGLSLGNEDVDDSRFLNCSELEGIAFNHEEITNDDKHYHRNAQKINKIRDHALQFPVTNGLESTLEIQSRRDER